MIWEDPLKSSSSRKERRSIKDEFKDEVNSFVQNNMLADYLSNLALSIICETSKIDYRMTVAMTGTYEEVASFAELEEFFEELELPFLSSLALTFSDNQEKHKTLIKHFKAFKEAHIFLALGAVIEDKELSSLTEGAIGNKLLNGISIGERKQHGDYVDMLIRFLDTGLKKASKDKKSCMGYLVHAFFKSAIKGNSSILSEKDFVFQRFILFSKLLRDILSEQFLLLKKGYEQLMYGDVV